MENRLDDVSLRFQNKGFMPIERPELIKDILNIMGTQKPCTIATIDRELEDLGWGINVIDNDTFALMTSLADGTIQ